MGHSFWWVDRFLPGLLDSGIFFLLGNMVQTYRLKKHIDKRTDEQTQTLKNHIDQGNGHA